MLACAAVVLTLSACESSILADNGNTAVEESRLASDSGVSEYPESALVFKTSSLISSAQAGSKDNILMQATGAQGVFGISKDDKTTNKPALENYSETTLFYLCNATPWHSNC